MLYVSWNLECVFSLVLEFLVDKLPQVLLVYLLIVFKPLPIEFLSLLVDEKATSCQGISS